MRRETVYIELAGQKHPMRMTLRAAKEINAKFGSFTAMGEALKGPVAPDGEGTSATADAVDARINAINELLKILLKAGRCYESLMGTELPPPLQCDPIDLIDADDTQTLTAIFAAMKNDTAREVETVPKNGEATLSDQAQRGSTTTASERD